MLLPGFTGKHVQFRGRVYQIVRARLEQGETLGDRIIYTLASGREEFDIPAQQCLPRAVQEDEC